MSKERPILFSGAMVRAILEGRKSQTRRVVKGADEHGGAIACDGRTLTYAETNPHTGEHVRRHGLGCPYGKPGDRLWVRETFFDVRPFRSAPLFAGVTGDFIYRADYEYRERRGEGKVIGCHAWKPSIFMPREASRLLLEVTDVRVEQLHHIREGEAMAEGVGVFGYAQPYSALGAIAGIAAVSKYHLEMDQVKRLGGLSNFDLAIGCKGMIRRATARAAFAALWVSINGLESWKENPWVWVVEFRKLERREW